MCLLASGLVNAAVISNGSLTVTIRDDNGAIDTVLFGGADYFNPGTAVSDFGFQNGSDTATFVRNSTTGTIGQPVSVFATLVTGTYTGGGANVEFTRSYSFVADLNVLRVETDIINHGGDLTLSYFDTFDPDQGSDLGQGFSTRNDVFDLGSGLAGQSRLDSGGYQHTVIVGSTDPRATIAAGSPFRIDTGATLNSFIAAPHDGNDALADQGLHIGLQTFLSGGQSTSFAYDLAFGLSAPAAQLAALTAQSDAIPTVLVANAGNPADGAGFGSVGAKYRIGITEVTNAQYAAFLNAKAASDPLELYNDSMGSSPLGGITRSGVDGSYTYEVKPGAGQKPVNFVSWYDAARFANWLHNGEGLGDTESGAYTLLGGTPVPTNAGSIERDAGARWFLPSEDEWYKAAYHKNDGTTGNYWDYPTSTDSAPYSDQPPGSDAPLKSNTANFRFTDLVANGYDDGFAVTGSNSFSSSQNYLTDVGAYALSISPYGTFDQAGNVWEWTEGHDDSLTRILRGGGYASDKEDVSQLHRLADPPTLEVSSVGFRIATVPEPSSWAMLVTGALAALVVNRRRKALVSRVGRSLNASSARIAADKPNAMRAPARYAALLVSVCGWAIQANAQTALDDYVAATDAYSTVGLGSTYSLSNTFTGPGYTAYVLEVTSLEWRTSADVDRTDWEHYLTVIVPITISKQQALLYIGEGANTAGPPTSPDALLSALGSIAVSTGSVTAQLRTVPNQPLDFTGGPGPLAEDAAIAHTLDKFLDEPSDDTWPLLLPMTKSAVRAMDTVQDYAATLPGLPEIENFVVTGGSKRGWTTWLTGAVDDRVMAIVPMSFDALNLDEQVVHHAAFYADVTQDIVGGFSDAVHDYVDADVFSRLDTPEGQALLGIIDPYEYQDRYADMPKYLVNSAGDQFFVPDSYQFYDDLPGDTYLRYVPNTDHSLLQAFADVAGGIRTFYDAIIDGAPLPEFSWELLDDNTIRVESLTTPLAVRLWQATNSTDRDFRYTTLGAAWTDSLLVDQGGGVYLGEITPPASGYTAFFVELKFPGDGLSTHTFTTQIYVTPEPSSLVLALITVVVAGGVYWLPKARRPLLLGRGRDKTQAH